MRSIFALAIAFFLLTACSSPQVTVTRSAEVTVTLLATRTPLPTPTGTPEPSATPSATYTPTPDIVKFDAQTWASMVANGENLKALDNLPATMTIDGVEMNKGTFSTVDGQNHMVIYYDTNGDYAGSQNMLTGKFEKTGTGAIEVFRTEDGGYYEMRAFGFVGMNEEQAKKAAEEMLYEVLVNDGVTYGVGAVQISLNRDISPLNRLRTIVGLRDRGVFVTTFFVNEQRALLDCAGFELDGETVFSYSSDEQFIEFKFLRNTNPTTFKNNLRGGGYELPKGL
jgi:hypothetical protein